MGGGRGKWGQSVRGSGGAHCMHGWWGGIVAGQKRGQAARSGAERGLPDDTGTWFFMLLMGAGIRGSYTRLLDAAWPHGVVAAPGGAERGLRDTSRGIPRYMDLQAVDGYRYTRLIYKRLLDTAWSQNVAERETWVLTVPV